MRIIAAVRLPLCGMSGQTIEILRGNILRFAIVILRFEILESVILRHKEPV
jgi:hypothetical protein